MKFFITNKKKKFNNHQIVLWSDRSFDNNILSIINYIEENEIDIKKTFCELIDNLNIYKINEKNLIDYLNLENSYSFFWCSDFYEKSFYKNPEIINQLKLIALKKLITEFRPEQVAINIDSTKDIKSIEILCKSLNIKFINNNKVFYLDFNFKYLYTPFWSIIKFLRFIYFRISLKKINWYKIKKLKNKKVFFSYSIYSNKNLLSEGIQNSSYWNPLINLKLLNNVLWINIFFHTKNNSLRNELKYYDNVNKLKNEHTIFLEQLFDIKIFFKVIYLYFKILFNIFFLEKSIKKYLKYKKSFYLKFYFFKYFNMSFMEVNSLVSIYYYLLLMKLKTKVSDIDKIFYLFENQGWEKSLNFLFNENFKTIAVNHASIRNWDIRFTNDKNINTKCVPHYYASNGKDSYKKLIQNNFDKKKIINLEALRYYDLLQNINNLGKVNLSSVLIVSDVHEEGNKSLEKMLQKISQKKFASNEFWLKEHLLKKTDFQVDFKINKTQKKLYELQSICKVAIVSGTTSAAIDLLLMGFELIIPININSLNFSPLKDHEKVTFVSDYSKINDILIQKLEKFKMNSNLQFENNFFEYNPHLDNWKKILDES